MLPLALLCLSSGLSSIALGLYLKKAPKAPKKIKKGKNKGQKTAPPPNPKGFLVGGVLLSLAGLGCLIAHLT